MNTNNEHKGFSRRAVLRGTSVFGGGLFMALNIQRPMALAAMNNDAPAVLSPTQWQTVEAITGRIIPTDHQPGAIEANCVNFIDKALANEDAASRPDFLAGLTALDAACEKTEGKAFIELEPAQQDKLLAAMTSDTAKPWPDSAPAASSFFELLRALTIMGFMADPKYGGNADVAGWRVARYPGPRHHTGGYTAAQMVGEEDIITVWGEKM
jgi:gluconate 2-dehydrogenase gamma chain